MNSEPLPIGRPSYWPIQSGSAVKLSHEVARERGRWYTAREGRWHEFRWTERGVWVERSLSRSVPLMSSQETHWNQPGIWDIQVWLTGFAYFGRPIGRRSPDHSTWLSAKSDGERESHRCMSHTTPPRITIYIANMSSHPVSLSFSSSPQCLRMPCNPRPRWPGESFGSWIAIFCPPWLLSVISPCVYQAPSRLCLS